MFSRHERFESRAMERGMHLWRFGHYGVPLLVMPSSAGIAHEWQYNGLIEGLRPMIEAGRLKLYCTESNVAESWADFEGDPRSRVERHRAFERYVRDELVPFIWADCRTDGIRLAVAGTSLGAFYSANLALKHPETFFYALCMSGRYDATWLTNGFDDIEVYYNNPVAFVPNLEGDDLERVRRNTHLDLICGHGAYEGANVRATIEFARALRAKGIRHRRELWVEASHEPEWWVRQAVHYLGERFGDEANRDQASAM